MGQTGGTIIKNTLTKQHRTAELATIKTQLITEWKRLGSREPETPPTHHGWANMGLWERDKNRMPQCWKAHGSECTA